MKFKLKVDLFCILIWITIIYSSNVIRSLQLLVKVCTRLRKESLDSWCENRKLTFKLSTKSSVRMSYNLTQDKFYSLVCRILITVFISYLYFYIVFMFFLCL